jgi:hypothetical protein
MAVKLVVFISGTMRDLPDERHPRDLRPATPALLLEKIAQYRGPVKLTLMPEANATARCRRRCFSPR